MNDITLLFSSRELFATLRIMTEEDQFQEEGHISFDGTKFEIGIGNQTVGTLLINEDKVL